jgi:Tol biopolymer transport system component
VSKINEPAAWRARETREGFAARARFAGSAVVALVLLTAGLGNAEPARTVFAGKNGLIAFQSFRDGPSQIYLETVPPTPVRRLTALTHCYALPAWSRDGRWLAYEYNPSPTGLHSSQSDIYVMNPYARHPLATARPLTRTPGFDGDPSWSPTGKQIVFESTRSGNSDVWVMDADGRNPHDLTANSPEFDGDPAWSPGGNRIAFTSMRDGNKEIYLMNPDGSNPINITNSPADDFDPAWSPDGQFVPFVSNRDRNLEIYETNDRFLLKRLTHDTGLDAFPSFSPDGKWVAFSTDRGDTGNRDLHYMSANGDGEGATQLTQAPGWDQAPDWQSKPLSTSTRIPLARAPLNLPHKASQSDTKAAVACIGNSR